MRLTIYFLQQTLSLVTITITIISMTIIYHMAVRDQRRLSSRSVVRRMLKVKADLGAREGLVSSYSPTLPSVSVSVLGVLS